MTGTEIIALTSASNPFFAKSGDTSVVLSWLNKISTDLYSDIQKRIPNEYISESTVTLAAGTTSYALPADFDNINPQVPIKKSRRYIFNPDYNSPGYISISDDKDSVQCGLFKFDANDKVEEIWDITGKGSSQTGYWLDLKNSNIEITPADFSQTGARTFRYIPKFTALTDEGDDIFMPRDEDEKWQEFWIWSLSEKWAKFVDHNFALAGEYSAEKQAIWSDMLGVIEPNKKRIIST